MRFNDAKNERKFLHIVTLIEHFELYFYQFYKIYISNMFSKLHLYSIHKIHVTLIYTKKYYKSFILLLNIYCKFYLSNYKL